MVGEKRPSGELKQRIFGVMQPDQQLEHQPVSGWLTVNGKNRPDLEESISARLSQAIGEGSVKSRDLEYLRQYELALLNHTSRLSDTHLELLRKLTASWDLRASPRTITSHRPIIGKFIVLVKRLIFPLVRAALKDELNQQRAFNGAVIEFLAVAGEGEKE